MTVVIHGLHKRLLANPLIRLVMAAAGGRDFFLVGGHLRDELLGRVGNDFDFVIAEGYELVAVAVAHRLGSRVIPLGRQGLLRIVSHEGDILDFSVLGDTIENNLGGRDFTINALAWSPRQGLIDKHQGISHLAERKLEIVSPYCLAKDPVRIVRAYRLSQELGFTISELTREAIHQYRSSLSTAKSERITIEFFKILNGSSVAETLGQMLSDGVLTQIILCSYETLEAKLKVICNILSTWHLHQNGPQQSSTSSAQGLTGRGLILAIALLYGEENYHLTVGRCVSNRLRKALNVTMEASTWGGNPSCKQLFHIFRIMGEEAADILIACGLQIHLDQLAKYRTIMRIPLLTPREIIALAGDTRGAQLGMLIQALNMASFCGELTKREEATALIKQHTTTPDDLT